MRTIDNFDKNKIKAILFDSGRVLNISATGHWFIAPNFFKYIDKNEFNSIKKSQKKLAFSKASEYISKHPLIIDEKEEFEQFTHYYKILLENFPQLQVTPENLEEITVDYVYNYDKYKFFDDALAIIPELNKNYKLGVISDAWPSLEGVFKKANLRDYFQTFIISSQKGVRKPHELMYTSAIDELEIAPDEAIFIDDNIKNCNAATELGITSFLLCRDFKSYIYHKLKYRNCNIIRNLLDLNKFLN